jgi:hypothetical protein
MPDIHIKTDAPNQTQKYFITEFLMKNSKKLKIIAKKVLANNQLHYAMNKLYVDSNSKI